MRMFGSVGVAVKYEYNLRDILFKDLLLDIPASHTRKNQNPLKMTLERFLQPDQKRGWLLRTLEDKGMFRITDVPE